MPTVSGRHVSVHERNEAEAAEAELIEKIAEFTHDPLGFVKFAYPWGEEGTELEGFDGPEDWQRELLDSIGKKLRAGAHFESAIQEATGSGHGVGKSAVVAWILDWGVSTFEDTRGVVTANTDTQLRTKTWAELAKWHRLCITGHWFELTATALYSKDPEHQKTWRIDIIPWSENRPEAFAGLHNQGKRIILIFDEASAISDKIWETSEGALTDRDTEILWLAFGNLTRTVGRFKDCFGRFAHRWTTRNVDSRDVGITNKTQLSAWVDDHGEDSDFVRVRIRGLSPKSDVNALLGEDEIRTAMARKLPRSAYEQAPKILGVDVARQGGDRSTICPRQGLVAFKPKAMRIHDTMLVADAVARAWDKWDADACMVDCTGGWGWAVYDRLVQMGYRPMAVEFGGTPFNPRFKNKRAEIWWDMATWVKEGGVLPNVPQLERELLAQYYWHDKKDKLALEDKEFVRTLIGESPDLGDGYACTFAYKVSKKTAVKQQFAETRFDPRTAGKEEGHFVTGAQLPQRGFGRKGG